MTGIPVLRTLALLAVAASVSLAGGGGGDSRTDTGTDSPDLAIMKVGPDVTDVPLELDLPATLGGDRPADEPR